MTNKPMNTETDQTKGDVSVGGATSRPVARRVRGMFEHRKVLQRFEKTIHTWAMQALMRAGYRREWAYSRAMAYVRATRIIQAADAMDAATMLKHARSIELAERTITEIAKEVGAASKGSTASGLRPSRSKVKAPTVDDESRACDAPALDDASAEEPETALDNGPRDTLYRPET